MSDGSGSSIPPGWFADPQHHGQERWWSGQDWTEHTRPRAAASHDSVSAAAPAAAAPKAPAGPRRRLRALDVVTIVVIALLVLAAVPTGAAGVAMMLMLVAIVGALWALFRGRSRTFHIRSRPVALGVLVTAFAVLMGSAGAYGAMHPTRAVIAAPESSRATPEQNKPVAAAVQPTPTVSDTPATVKRATVAVSKKSALAVLATLTIKGKSPLAGYDRVADFGPAWLDVDRNGCDTRNDVLRRDLTATTGKGCRVITGTLKDPYTGKTIDFVRGTRRPPPSRSITWSPSGTRGRPVLRS